MLQGFLTAAAPQKKAIPLLPQCGICQIYKSCRSPKMPVFGKGRKRILILGEAPGFSEDEQGRPFIGKAGQLLQDTLQKFDVDMERDCWVTNSLICHPHKDGKNRTPTDREIEYCRPNVVKAVKELKPHVIIPLGGSAVKSLIGWLWKEKVGKVSRWDGWKIPAQSINAWVCPTWHPSYILRTDYGSQKENEVRTMFFEKHLEAACSLEGRPWKEMPNWPAEVRKIYDPIEAAREIRKLMSHSANVVAFDLETDRSKPDHKDAQIICCSVSNGRRTFAFPWHGEAIPAMKELLYSDVPKVGWSIKFETRWLAKLGWEVFNWVWDGMLAAHVLDNRPQITGLKFQSFVQLGMDAYDTEVSPYFESKNSNEPNRIKEVPLDKLLTYCGLDSLLEWMVAQMQMKKMGVIEWLRTGKSQ